MIQYAWNNTIRRAEKLRRPWMRGQRTFGNDILVRGKTHPDCHPPLTKPDGVMITSTTATSTNTGAIAPVPTLHKLVPAKSQRSSRMWGTAI
jgi:hypothetical protein